MNNFAFQVLTKCLDRFFSSKITIEKYLNSYFMCMWSKISCWNGLSRVEAVRTVWNVIRLATHRVLFFPHFYARISKNCRNRPTWLFLVLIFKFNGIRIVSSILWSWYYAHLCKWVIWNYVWYGVALKLSSFSRICHTNWALRLRAYR